MCKRFQKSGAWNSQVLRLCYLWELLWGNWRPLCHLVHMSLISLGPKTENHSWRQMWSSLQKLSWNRGLFAHHGFTWGGFAVSSLGLRLTFESISPGTLESTLTWSRCRSVYCCFSVLRCREKERREKKDRIENKLTYINQTRIC